MIRAHKYISNHTYIGKDLIEIKLSGNQKDSLNLHNLTNSLKINGFTPYLTDVNLKTGRIWYIYSFRTDSTAADFLKYYKRLRRQLYDKTIRN